MVVACRAGWPDQAYIHGTLSDIAEKVHAAKITPTAPIFVGHILNPANDFQESAPYDADHVHVLRLKKTAATND